MDLGLLNKVAVVTGASKGIGYATAQAFLQEGAKVAICARGEDDLRQAARELGALGQVFAQVVDVADDAQVDAFAQAVYERFGRLDCWVNNVGAARPRKGTDYTAEEVRWHTDICFSSVVYGTQAAARYMKMNSGGAIVNLASLAARCATCGRSTLYGPLKAAVVGLATTFAGELGAWNIRVNAVLPGFTATPAVQATISPQELAENRARTLLRKVASPQEIARPIVFLCSDGASAITATSLEISCGNTAVLNSDYSYQSRADQEPGWTGDQSPPTTGRE